MILHQQKLPAITAENELIPTKRVSFTISAHRNERTKPLPQHDANTPKVGKRAEYLITVDVALLVIWFLVLASGRRMRSTLVSSAWSTWFGRFLWGRGIG